jgi:hypothetical protein
VFLNRHGGAYRPGGDDAVTNTSPILSRSGFVPAFAGDDDDWRKIVDRVRARFAPFDVAIVDVEPPPATGYIEAVVGGFPRHLGFPSSLLGVAPVYCEPAETSIVFIFASQMPGDNPRIAALIEHEVGHAFSLDHEFLCKSPMSYLSGCGEKVFQHRTAECGEFGPRPCLCGSVTQNSFEILVDAVGSRDGRLRPLPRQAQGDAPEPVARCEVSASDGE